MDEDDCASLQGSNRPVHSTMPPADVSPHEGTLRIAVEGCGHGTLDSIYASTEKASKERGWHGVDLLIICGDFQACRNQQDLNMTAMPERFRKMADFHQYYYGQKTAPYLTIFVGGNHEASNHLFELYYGGWVAPNIYYMGAANVLRFGPLKIAAMSGIWKGADYRKPHFERLPYNEGTMRSIYHVRELDVRKLLSYRSQIDIGISHDWPQGIEWHGDHRRLFTQRSKWAEDAKTGKLGNKAATMIMDRLRPPYWFSGHMHWKYTAVKKYSKEALTHRAERRTEQTTKRAALASWHSFGEEAARRDAEEYQAEYQARQHHHAELQRTGKRPAVSYTLQETFKPVKIDNELGRVNTITNDTGPSLSASQLDGCGPSLALKRSRESGADVDERLQSVRGISQVDGVIDKNAVGTGADRDGVDRRCDLNQDSGIPSHTVVNAESPPVAFNPDAIDLESEDEANETPAERQVNQIGSNGCRVLSGATGEVVEAIKASDRIVPSTSGDISEEARATLASLSTTFMAAPIKSSDLPHPEMITNTQVSFLALSKVEPGKEFLQLLEIAPYQDPNVDTLEPRQPVNRPVKLSYDPEWLAILRVFAPELELDCTSKPISATSAVPPHLGDSHYRRRILEETEWTEENIVKNAGLEIPENFEITATQDSNWNEKIPVECTNAQTSTFCDLIGISNAFDISLDERQARMSAGPPPEHSWKENFGSSSQDGSGRGGSRGGSGFGTSRGNNRGRGRGRPTRSRW